MHVFEFSHDISVSHSPFRLESESFKEIKPGLSSFAKSPELAAESVAELLTMAKTVIPRSHQPHTPIALKATAGLRLLDETDADKILYQVERTVFNSGFLVDENSVGILSGVDEGVFGWFTLNYLLNRLVGKDENNSQKGDFTDTGAALDLGGGSTQLTFVPKNMAKTLGNLPAKQFSHRLRLFSQDVDFFTHSYLGNGLIAARLGIARLTTTEIERPAAGRNVLFTHCLPKNYKLDNWDYAGSKWTVLSTDSATAFVDCLTAARRYVGAISKVARVPELNDASLYVFSYFYDRGVQAQLLTDKNKGLIRVADYKHAAQKVCALKAGEIGVEHWRPWQCLDLVYIYALLRYGYGLLDEKQLHLTKKLKNKEVSWALGAGYHLLNTYHKRQQDATSACSVPQTCSLRAWYLRVSDDASYCIENNTSDAGSSVNHTKPARHRSLYSCIFAQLCHYVSDAATQILVLFKLTS